MALKRAGKHMPFNIKHIKPTEKFGITCSAIILGLGILFYNSDVFFPGEMTLYNITIYKAFELLIMAVFWSVVAFFAGRGVYNFYMHCEKYGKPTFAMKKITVARLIPVFVTLAIVIIATVVGVLLKFFPKMEYPYDKVIIVTAYIVWTMTIYALAHKITFKIKHYMDAKAARKDEESVEESNNN
jgi:fatty acid desaturase